MSELESLDNDEDEEDEEGKDDNDKGKIENECAGERGKDGKNDDVIEKDTKKRLTKRQRKNDARENKKKKYEAAIAGFRLGDYKSVNACAKAFGVNQSCLATYLKSGKGFVGAGKQSIVFTHDKEKRIVKFVTDRVNLGVGVDFH